MRPRIDPASLTPFNEALYDLRVREAMSAGPVTLGVDATMLDAQHLMRDHRVSGIPIVNDARELLGLVSIQDVVEALVDHDISAPVGQWMTSKVVTVRDDLPLIQAVNEMHRRGFGRLPALDKDGRLAGILTQGDITRAVMYRLNEEAKAAEEREHKALARTLQLSGEQPGVERIETPAEAMNLDTAGTFASSVKKALKRRGVEPDIVRRAAVAAYEAEVNVILHSMGGILEGLISSEEVTLVARDRGPGIANLEQALSEGYSTANEVVRALGFGAGMGLPNMQRCADTFSIEAPATGTTVTMKIGLVPKEPETKERES